ncbi:MAG: nuclear transport factor 2 family protein [Pseudomonadales bacterium]
MDTESLSDKQLICELQNNYSYAIDSGKYDNLDQMFLPDALYDFGPAGSADNLDDVKGTIRSALEPLTIAQHINGNPWAEIDGDTATAGCYLRVHMYRKETAGGEHFEMGGRYDDELVRTADGWRFAKRTITILWTEGNPDVRWVR